MIFMTLLLCVVASILLTPIVKRIALAVGATDQPNQRKVHQKIMPRLGGLAIYISFVIGYLFCVLKIPLHGHYYLQLPSSSLQE